MRKNVNLRNTRIQIDVQDEVVHDVKEVSLKC